MDSPQSPSLLQNDEQEEISTMAPQPTLAPEPDQESENAQDDKSLYPRLTFLSGSRDWTDSLVHDLRRLIELPRAYRVCDCPPCTRARFRAILSLPDDHDFCIIPADSPRGVQIREWLDPNECDEEWTAFDNQLQIYLVQTHFNREKETAAIKVLEATLLAEEKVLERKRKTLAMRQADLHFTVEQQAKRRIVD